MEIYNYTSLGEYLSTSQARIVEGETIIPAFATDVVPPEAKDGHARVFDESSNSWNYVVDKRGTTVWSIQGKEQSSVDYLGNINDGYTEQQPLDYSDWDANTNAWIINIETKIQAKRNEIEARFTAELNKGVTVDGNTYDCNDQAQARLTSAVTLAQTAQAAGIDYQPIPWVLADNNVHTIATLSELVQIALAVGAHVQRLFAVRNNHKQAIMQLTTADAIDAYDYSEGWDA